MGNAQSYSTGPPPSSIFPSKFLAANASAAAWNALDNGLSGVRTRHNYMKKIALLLLRIVVIGYLGTALLIFALFSFS